MKTLSIEELSALQAKCATDSLLATERVSESWSLSAEATERLRVSLATEALSQFAQCWFGEKYPKSQKFLDSQKGNE